MWGQKTNGGRKPVQYCLHCGLEAVIDDTEKPIPPCTMCKRDKFATKEQYDSLFLASVRIKAE
jgi:hypothetical protein